MSVPLIARAGDLLARYDVLFCDVWGVLHDGVTASPGANDALPRFRERGGTVVLVSNAPIPREAVARVLDAKGVRREAYDAILSSGDLTRAHWRAMGYGAIHHVGPSPRDDALFLGEPIQRVALADAEALVVTGLVRDDVETAEDYRALLERALRRASPLVCANPDLLVEVGGRAYPCAGAVAALYETMGGVVHWAGKPYAAAYDGALALARSLRGRDVPRDRVLMIGDAVRTDLAGAARAGIDALFVTSGIHRAGLLDPAGAIDPARLHALLDVPEARSTVAAMPALAW